MIVFQSVKCLVLDIQHQKMLKTCLIFKGCSGHPKSLGVSRS